MLGNWLCWVLYFFLLYDFCRFMSEVIDIFFVDENKLIVECCEKFKVLCGQGIVYLNDFCCEDFVGCLQEEFVDVGQWIVEVLEGNGCQVKMVGCLMVKCIMGKVSFVQIQDEFGCIQLFLQGVVLGDVYIVFKGWDVGDIIVVEGGLICIKIGELLVKVELICLLIKLLCLLLDKWYGLVDVEQCYCQCYVDLIVILELCVVFIKCLKIICVMCVWLDNCDFLEVEMLMMYYIFGGVVVKLFIIYYNVLDLDLYLCVVLELYFK